MDLFELAAITDEVSDDLEEALNCLKAEGLGKVELRSLWQTNIADLSKTQVDRARDLLRDTGMRVVSIASPFLKCHLPGFESGEEMGDVFSARAATLEEHWDVLERSLTMCIAFEAPILRCFSFWRLPQGAEAGPAVRDALRTAAARCRSAGVVLGLENEAACIVGTGAEMAALVGETHDLEGLTVIWDPGNAATLGEQPYPMGYSALRAANASISHVHVKDLAHERDAAGRPRFVAVTKGTVDYVGQLVALAHDGYRGTLSLEPHVQRGPEGMHGCIAGLRAAIAEADRQLATS